MAGVQDRCSPHCLTLHWNVLGSYEKKSPYRLEGGLGFWLQEVSCIYVCKHTCREKIVEINHRIIEYSELERTHWDHHHPASGLAQDSPKTTPHAWEHCLNVSWAWAGLMLWPQSRGACLSPSHPLSEKPSPNIQPRPPLTQLHALGSCHWAPERRDQSLPLCFPSWGSCRQL